MMAKELMPMPPDGLRQRVLTPTEIKVMKNACLTEVNGHPALTAIKDFEEFCKLLARPENHIMIPGTQFIETQVNTYQTQEMTNQMAQELTKLPRFIAYARIISEVAGKQIVGNHLMQTLPMPKITNVNMESVAIANGQTLCKLREDIKADIRERQTKWRRGPEPPKQTQRR